MALRLAEILADAPERFCLLEAFGYDRVIDEALLDAAFEDVLQDVAQPALRLRR